MAYNIQGQSLVFSASVYDQYNTLIATSTYDPGGWPSGNSTAIFNLNAPVDMAANATIKIDIHQEVWSYYYAAHYQVGNSLGNVDGITQTAGTTMGISLYKTPAPTSTVSLDFPSSSSSTPFDLMTPDFSNWVLSAHNLDTSEQFMFGVAYQNFNLPTSTPLIIDQIRAQFTGGYVNNYVIPKSHLLMNATTTASSWYAFAFLEDWYTGDVVAISPTFFFTVCDQAICPAPTSTLAQLAAPFTPSFLFQGCDPNDNIILYGICRLFTPSQESLSHLADLKNSVMDKPPIGYVAILISDIQGLNTSSTPAFILLAPSVVADFHGIFYYIDEALGIAVVLLGLMWAFHRGRNLKL